MTVIATNDLVGITRGRSVPTTQLDRYARSGIGWLPANLALTPFNTIASPNIWGSRGDLRMLPDLEARFQFDGGAATTAFDLVMGDIVELDGTPWPCCPRRLLRTAIDALRAHGLVLIAAFEQEFQLAGLPDQASHALSIGALRAVDPFPSRLYDALAQAGTAPEMIIAEFGQGQFEVMCEPAPALQAADRSIAIREIVRDVARSSGMRASFSPKTALDSVGNGVHVHLSLTDLDGNPVLYDPDRPGGLSAIGGHFFGGIMRHLRALPFYTAPGIPSYFRLRPNSWSSAWTWMAVQDREATLRICPTSTIGGGDVARQYNVEYRATDATANAYVVLASLIHAGLAGLADTLPAPNLAGPSPDAMHDDEREQAGIVRLPDSVTAAIEACEADPVARGWFPEGVYQTLLDLRATERRHVADLDDEAMCRLYFERY